MLRKQISIAIVLAIIVLAIIAVVSRTNTQIQIHQLDLKTKQQEIQTVESQLEANQTKLEKAQGDQKKLKEVEEQNKKLQDEIKALQARKAEKARIALLEADNPVQATEQAPVAISGDCASWMSEAGITHALARDLIQRESGCNHLAVNPSSGACGIPQALPCSKLPQGLNTPPVEQLKWMQNYVMARYGSWESAIAFHDSNNWY